MKRICNTLVLFFLFLIQLNSQITFNKRYDFDGLNNIITSVYPTDSCYYATGVIPDTFNLAAIGNVFIKFGLGREYFI